MSPRTHQHPHVVELRGATVSFGDRTVWSDLDLSVAPGELIAVVGPNGAGKSTLLRVLLGLQPLDAGTAHICDEVPHLGCELVGYVPQQRGFDRDLPIRGRDLAGFGLDGHRFGLRRSRADRALVDEAIAAVGATGYADHPVGTLSGGEQQRLRIAQALLTDPHVLLCDEPLLSLDLAQQQAVAQLIEQRRRTRGTAVLIVTHEINPILPYVDRVLYIARGRWAIGQPDEVLTSERLTGLYGSRVDVVSVGDRLVVVASEDPTGPSHHPEPPPHHVVRGHHSPADRARLSRRERGR